MEKLCEEFNSMSLSEDETELAHLSARLVADFPGCSTLEEFRLQISRNFYKAYYAIIYGEASQASKEAAEELRRCFEQTLETVDGVDPGPMKGFMDALKGHP
ncbi:unnamed protein product [Bursaphelenchus xylophilus]|uniref:(pine wood nematode) hypothetical protein n=1 Tax=Bursaphelenchus xylophilus TaxID=6326 RepID=A0A811LTZ7_BURXY|nr:unnamed protein product [Bursaphelenchus xylophilus]CAG9121131.1 unnamed protein product [Bursaphelenchus xylophilus]